MFQCGACLLFYNVSSCWEICPCEFLLNFSAIAVLDLQSTSSLFAHGWGFAAERDQTDLWVQSSKCTCNCATDADLQSFDYVWPNSPQITKYSPTFLTNFSSTLRDQSKSVMCCTKRAGVTRICCSNLTRPAISCFQLRSICNALERGSPTRHLEDFNTILNHLIYSYWQMLCLYL